MKASRFLAMLCVLGVMCSAGFAEEEAENFTPPAYKVLRHLEDWSGLAKRGEDEKADFFDSVKYVALSEDGAVWVSFGGQVRERMEVWNNFNFSAPATADDSDIYLLTRVLFHSDLHLGEDARIFVEGKSAWVTDRELVGGRRTLDVDQLDLQNAFADIAVDLSESARLTNRLGRQELLFGKQRLVSPLDWSNTRRTFDGASMIVEVEGWKVTGFWTRPVPVQKYEFNDSTHAQAFYGAYATRGNGLDIYYLGLNRDAAAFNGTAGREDRHTVGSRISGKIAKSSLDYDLEGAYQFGEVGSGNINAYMVSGEMGKKFAEVAMAPRVYIGFDYASGDDNPGGNVETFNQLFPLGHAYLGYIDTVGRQNNVDLRTGVSCKPAKKLTAKLDAHFLWRADDEDALYNAGGGVVRAGAAGSSKDLGTELDLTLKYKYDRHLVLVLGYSHFFPGQFIKESGPGGGIDFIYTAAQFTF